MANNLSLAFSVVFPLFFMMFLGYILRRAKILTQDLAKQLNLITFRVFLPLLMFVNIYDSDFAAHFSIKLIGFAVGAVILTFLVIMLIIPMIVKDPKQCGVVIQGIFRSNFAIFGMPVVAYIYGDGNLTTAAILLAFLIPLFNCLAVIALQRFSAHTRGAKDVLMEIVKNPLIISSVVALAIKFAGISLPEVLLSPMHDLSAVATPLALTALGGTFEFRGVRRSFWPLLLTVFCRLVLVPLVFIPIAVYLGFREVELIVLFIMFGSPAAVSSYTMAHSMGADSDLAAQVVVFTSLCSIFTVFLWITVLGNFSLL